MKLFFKNKKKSPFYYLNYSEVILLYKKDYLKIKRELPFHTIDEYSKYVIISLNCPYTYQADYKKFFHYGDLFECGNKYPRNLNNNGEILAFSLDKHENVISTESCNPCNMCKNELSCMFSKIKMDFKPKEYDLLNFVDKFKQMGMYESENLYREYIVAAGDYSSYSDIEGMTWQDLIASLLLIIPLALVYLPFYFAYLLFEKIYFIFKKNKKAGV